MIDFIILGAAKCGTTSLANMLASHPQVCFCQHKEPHFFSQDIYWKQNLWKYKEMFKPLPGQICGEGSTSYTMYPEFCLNIWDNLYEINPELRFIYIMRNPLERIVSQYMHCYLRGLTSEPIETAILNNPIYINRTRYYTQIQPYIKVFGSENILLLTFEDFTNNTKDSISSIAQFLSIDNSLFRTTWDHSNSSINSQKNDERLDKIARKILALQSLKKMLPKKASIYLYRSLQNTFSRKIKVKPTLSNEMKKVIYDFLILDIFKIQKQMDRELVEWHDFFSIR